LTWLNDFRDCRRDIAADQIASAAAVDKTDIQSSGASQTTATVSLAFVDQKSTNPAPSLTISNESPLVDDNQLVNGVFRLFASGTSEMEAASEVQKGELDLVAAGREEVRHLNVSVDQLKSDFDRLQTVFHVECASMKEYRRNSQSCRLTR
jgi:hypothetical protein